MNHSEARESLHAARIALTRHLIAAMHAGDGVAAAQLLASRDAITDHIERLLLAELTLTVTQVRTACEEIAAATRELDELDAKSDQIAKVIGIASKVLQGAAKLATVAVGG